MLRIINIIHDTTVDGPGFRTSIYAAGCRHACYGCHNPQSWPRWAGRDMSVGEVLMQVLSDPFAHVTFTGGDPMFQAAEFARLAKQIKRMSDKTIWCYTGFTFERLQANPMHLDGIEQLLPLIDVLVDGRYVEQLRDTDLLFRGSSNQRLIDVRRSLECGQTVLWQ